MSGKTVSKIMQNTSSIPVEEIPRFFEMLMECNKESEISKREIKRYDSMKEVMIREITGKYNFYEFLFSKIFAERHETIKKDFEIIDEGIKLNDKDLIATGVAGLSQIVASSPIADLEKLRRMLGQ